LENYKGIWISYRDWHKNHKKWMECDFNDLNGAEVEDLTN